MDSLIHHLDAGQELSAREIEVAAEFLLDAHGSAEKKAQLLESLSRKGETPAEIAGFVETFLGARGQSSSEFVRVRGADD